MRFHVLPGFCVGGRGESPGSIVTRRGFGTCPPLGPTSLYSPGRFGFSPGFCVATCSLLVWVRYVPSRFGLPGLESRLIASAQPPRLRRAGQAPQPRSHPTSPVTAWVRFIGTTT